MKLQFIFNYHVLEVVEATELEIKQLYIILTEKGFNFQTKESYQECQFGKEKYMPAGLWQRVYDLRKSGWSVEILNLNDFLHTKYDRASFYEWCDNLGLKYPLYAYQREGAYLAYANRISKISAATGGGKSLTQYVLARFVLEKYLNRLGLKVLLIVPRVQLCHQMEKDFAEYEEPLDTPFLKVDKLYGGSKRNPNSNIVVANIDSAANMDQNFFEQFGMIMFDEGHKMGTSKQYKAIYHYVNKDKIQFVTGLSGTFHVGGVAQLLQDAYLGRTVIDLKAYELQELGTISKVKINAIQINYDIISSRNYYMTPGIDEMAGRYNVELAYIRSLQRRLNVMSDTMKAIDGNQVVLFISKEYMRMFLEHLQQNCTGKEICEISGDIPASKRMQICSRFEEIDNGIICATYSTMDTGVSIKRLMHIHFADSCKSFIRIVQSIGRALRLHPDKDFAFIWDWIDHFMKPDGTKYTDPLTGEIKTAELPGPKANISLRQSKERQKIYKEMKYPYKIKQVNLIC